LSAHAAADEDRTRVEDIELAGELLPPVHIHHVLGVAARQIDLDETVEDKKEVDPSIAALEYPSVYGRLPRTSGHRSHAVFRESAAVRVDWIPTMRQPAGPLLRGHRRLPGGSTRLLDGLKAPSRPDEDLRAQHVLGRHLQLAATIDTG